MKNSTDQLVRDYLGKEKKRLKCSRESRRRFLVEVGQMMEEFKDGYPKVTRKELYGFLGDPKQLILNFMEQLNPEEVRKAQKKKIYRIAGVILAAAVLLAIALFLIWHNSVSNIVLLYGAS